MGAGIAQVAAQTGHKVTLVDISQQVRKEMKSFCPKKRFPKVLDKSNARISESIKRVAKNSLLTMLTLLGNSLTGRSLPMKRTPSIKKSNAPRFFCLPITPFLPK